MPWYVIEIIILILFVIFGASYCYLLFKHRNDEEKEFEDMQARFEKIIGRVKLKKAQEEKYKDITDG